MKKMLIKKDFFLKDISVIVQDIVMPELKEKTIFTFAGPLGVGKTTLIKEIFKQCGVTSIVTSPTFSYVKSYHGSDNKILNHFDLYRIDSLESFIQAGLDEYLCKSGEYNFIEWPEVIGALLDSDGMRANVCSVFLNYSLDNSFLRSLKVLK